MTSQGPGSFPRVKKKLSQAGSREATADQQNSASGEGSLGCKWLGGFFEHNWEKGQTEREGYGFFQPFYWEVAIDINDDNSDDDDRQGDRYAITDWPSKVGQILCWILYVYSPITYSIIDMISSIPEMQKPEAKLKSNGPWLGKGQNQDLTLVCP